MSFTFQQALTGLDSSAQQLDVLANNIANSGTTGFKRSARASPSATCLRTRCRQLTTTRLVLGLACRRSTRSSLRAV
ncbi:MAG: hypothetical protein EBS54_09800 [Betaproteobacteria bacterium]|nr:hypothetical protein [Betaproteobacteria bacterium]